MVGMKKLSVILFLYSVTMLLLGGCTYYYPYDSYYPDNYGFVAPFYYYSPAGYYSYSPYPSSYPYEYYYYYPSTRFYLGKTPEDFRERKFQPGERSGGEK